MDNAMSRRNFLAASAAAGAMGAAGAIGVHGADASEIKGDAGLDPEVLRAWLQDRHNYSAAANAGQFLPGEENAPTDEELQVMFRIANSYMWCHELTAPHFVVVRDPAEQQAIVGSMGVTGDGTVTILMLADGCKDQEHHEATYSQSRTEPVHYWEMYYALNEAGEALAYLNMAARTYGYRIRNYGALDVPNLSYEQGLGEQDVIPLWECGGNWDYIRGDNWDIAKYCHPKDDQSKDFHHFALVEADTIKLDGNLTLIFATVMGKVDEDALDTSVTDFGAQGSVISPIYPEPYDWTQIQENYSFWDTGVDGADIHEAPENYEADAQAWTKAYEEENGVVSSHQGVDSNVWDTAASAHQD